jgi:hypothetical protein
LSAVELQKPQHILQDLTEFSDLRRAHRSLLRGGRKVLIEAPLEIPFQKLHALFRADFFRPATPGLMELFEMDHLTHSK